MNKLQQLIFNNGERLVPYVSHDDAELVRHRSSYSFFRTVIASDLAIRSVVDTQLTVADLGFGSGYGCALLSSLPNSRITGVDIGEECEIFARQYYPRVNVNYQIEDLSSYIPDAEPFDYVVSRGVLEHVPEGLGLVKNVKFRQRVMIDVPYDEAPGNEHHVITGITEGSFADLENCEFFYEDIDGRIFDAANKPAKSNMIMVVLSAPELPKVSDLFDFPIAPVKDRKIEIFNGINGTGDRYYFNSAPELLTAIEKTIKETEVALDIGCGIVPMNYFRPKMHFMVEPWLEYSNILEYRYSGDKSITIFRSGALETLRLLGDNSVDSIFLLDVIEHLAKEEGLSVILESERVAREQIVIFTPLGYMDQHMENGQVDGWGLGGSAVQEHRSGWDPEDFDTTWSLYICKDFHANDFRGKLLPISHGAFYAIRNFDRKIAIKPDAYSDIRRPLPSELESEVLKEKYNALFLQHQALINFPLVALALSIRRIIKRFLR